MTNTTTTRVELGKNSTELWFNAVNARPKLINVTFERTVDGGYQVQEAAILNRVNQHQANWVKADVRALARDIKRRGMHAK